jgi:2-keto-4-pentenoate hydratase
MILRTIVMNQRIQAIADRLWQAESSGQPTTPVRDDVAAAALGGDVLALAYQIQQLNTKRRLDAGARLVGRKIGLTSRRCNNNSASIRPILAHCWPTWRSATARRSPGRA